MAPLTGTQLYKLLQTQHHCGVAEPQLPGTHTCSHNPRQPWVFKQKDVNTVFPEYHPWVGGTSVPWELAGPPQAFRCVWEMLLQIKLCPHPKSNKKLCWSPKPYYLRKWLHLEIDGHYRCNWRRQWHPTPVLLPGKSHGRRGLVGCSPWGCWESDTTERLHFHFSLSCIGEGNGNPLQCACLENPRDGGAQWAAIYGVAQSRTQLKRLSCTRVMVLHWSSCVVAKSCLTLWQPHRL